MTTVQSQLIPEGQRIRAVEMVQAAFISLQLASKTLEAKPELTATDIITAQEHASAANCKLNSLRSLLRGNQSPRNGERE